MKNNALYPGTFDPITYGHIDVINKALKIVDKVIIAVSENSNKNYLFDINERLNIINNALFRDLKMKTSKIKVISFNSLIYSDGTNSSFFPYIIKPDVGHGAKKEKS